MITLLVIYGSVFAVCIASLSRPWIGLLGFYACVLLEPAWNWRWVIGKDNHFQTMLSVCCIAGWILAGCKLKKLHPVAKWGQAGLISYLIISYVAASRSIAPELTNIFMSSMWKIVLMAVLSIHLLDTKRKIAIALWVAVLAQGYSAFRINEDYFLTGVTRYAYREWGFMGDNNLYSNMTVPLFITSMCFALTMRDKRLASIAMILAVLQTHQIMLMESRGAMLAAVAATAFMAVAMNKISQVSMRLAFTIVASSALVGPTVLKEFSSIFSGAEDRDASAASRFDLWNAGLSMTADHPSLGVGPWAAQVDLGRYMNPPVYYPRAPHNLFLDISTGSGLPAACCYFSFFLLPIVSNFRRLRLLTRIRGDALDISITASVCFGLSGYLLAAFFSSAALCESPYLLASAGTAYSSLAIPIHRNENQMNENPKPPHES